MQIYNSLIIICSTPLSTVVRQLDSVVATVVIVVVGGMRGYTRHQWHILLTHTHLLYYIIIHFIVVMTSTNHSGVGVITVICYLLSFEHTPLRHYVLHHRRASEIIFDVFFIRTHARLLYMDFMGGEYYLFFIDTALKLKVQKKYISPEI